jgi:hypothetical protein
MSREKERYVVGDKPVRVAHTTTDRVPFLSNTGDVPVSVDVAPWPMDKALVIAPGVTVPFISPQPAGDSAPIFASCADGKGEIEVLFLR